MKSTENKSRIIVALDFASEAEALRLVEQLNKDKCRLKVGKELFTRAGPALVSRLTGLGFDVFLDLKYHDIPNTVAGACAAAADLGVWMVNVHALGGRWMMEAARERLERHATRPLLIAVTVLTSMGREDLEEVGLAQDPLQVVIRLARLAQESGLDGVVCSPEETPELRQRMGSEFALVTPGVRPQGAEHHDQIRVTTPAAAIRNGSSYLVIGRPITQAKDPLQALVEIENEVVGAIHESPLQSTTSE
jgi:orotidine-5'-phosphate decarboxylase